jgi:hypothetical protein
LAKVTPEFDQGLLTHSRPIECLLEAVSKVFLIGFTFNSGNIGAKSQ